MMDLAKTIKTTNNKLQPKHSSQLFKYYNQRKRIVQQKRSNKSAKKINDGILIEENKKEENKIVEENKIIIKEVIENNKDILLEKNKIRNEGIEFKYSSSPQLQQNQSSSFSSSPQCSSPSTQLPSFNKNILLNNINSFKRCSSARLVCNFEESILSGRLIPSSIVDGYSLQLMVVPIQSMSPNGGFLSVQRVNYPVQAFFFFNEMSESPDKFSTRTPALLHLARCELSSEGISIPRRCNLQAVLFNPQGSVIKIFMVEVDVRDMPPSSTTFIRQRTFNNETTGNNNNNYYFNSANNNNNNNNNLINNNNTGNNNNKIMSSSSASALRFLIHLRLSSNKTGRIRLHTDIRMLFSNKSTELEETTNCGNIKINTIAEMPNRPKYSPVK